MEQLAGVPSLDVKEGSLLHPTLGLLGKKGKFTLNHPGPTFVLFFLDLFCFAKAPQRECSTWHPGNAMVMETDAGGSSPENLKPVPRQPGLEGRSTETDLIPVLTETCPLGFSKSHRAFPLFLENFDKTAPRPMRKEGRRSHHKWIGDFRSLLSSASGGSEQTAMRNRL